MAMPKGQDGNLKNHNGQYKVLNMRAGEKTDTLHPQRNSEHDFAPLRFSKQVSFISDQLHVHVLIQIQSVPVDKIKASVRMTCTWSLVIFF